MYKIIGANHQEYGPVSADQIHAWIREGRANGQTLAQAAQTSEWKPLASFDEFAPTLSVEHPSPPIATTAAASTADAVLARGAEVNVGECLSRAWRLLVNNLALFLGASLLLLLIRFALGLVPIVGSLAYFVIFGALYGGFFMTFLKRVRGESAGIDDLFCGFGERFIQLMLAGIVMYVLTMIGMLLCVLPGIYLAVAWMFTLVLAADRCMEFWPAMEFSRKVITRYWFQIFGVLVVACLPLVLFMVYSIFRVFSVVYPLVANAGGRVNFSEITSAVSGFAALSGVQQLIMLFTLPFATAALMYAYEDLFGARPSQAA
jgi:uncharacterized membrane protein